MATSAFKPKTRRASLASSPDDSSYSNRSSSSVHRQTRSLSRVPRRLPGSGDDEATPVPKSRGRFVNTVRGAGFPEISLDDLAIELFDSSLRGRSASRIDDVTPHNGKGGGAGENVNQRRGRSVSRQEFRGSVVNNGARGRLTSDTASSRRRRSVSVVRYQISDSESDLDHSQNSSNRSSMKSSIVGNNQISSANKTTASNDRQGLRRSLSQKDFKYHDGYSSHSSAITDEGKDAALSNKNGMERTIRAVYAQKKGEHPIGDDVNGGLYAAMRNELRHAVEEIKTQLEQSMVKTKNPGIISGNSLRPDNPDVNQSVSAARRKCTTKLEKSEKRRKDLLAKILLEEQHGRELSELNTTDVEKPLRARKRSNDRYRMSQQLTEEAGKYIDDFISNVEDTDISSLDGDRSDTSSSIGGMTKSPIFQNPAAFKSVPVEMDGVNLPWLQWETTNGGSPSPCKNKHNLSQEASSAQDLSDRLTTSSRGSWSPEFSDCRPSKDVAESGGGNYQSQISFSNKRTMKLDLDDYLKPNCDEALLLETWSQRYGINSGTLLLCNHIFS
ncbi:DELLA protein GAI1-like [Hibiscus syriacus]|uniref:DELLA protein GAI1-like n=1 Tax=Hibiscus syriacus TaxID=106335 RepID=A0A6A2X8B2_HIBSY|nr:uncharacterized protein LOC120191939 isoform X2 [Hibiscus syriacus]KAE8658316.1 DELLA protein GAI1-like [Hibiscus syriacus]